MKKRTRVTWITRKEVPIWCCDFGGFKSDRDGLLAEIAASQAVIDQQHENSLLVAVDLAHVHFTPEIVAFFDANPRHPHKPIRRLAVLGLPDIQRFWYQRVKRVNFPPTTRFFHDWEQAKDWLVAE